MKIASQILIRFQSLASIWQKLQRRKRSNVQRMAYDSYAVFMSKELAAKRRSK